MKKRLIKYVTLSSLLLSNMTGTMDVFAERAIDKDIVEETTTEVKNEQEEGQSVAERNVVSSMWGTAPVEFDADTGVLTVYAGTLKTLDTAYVDDAEKIQKYFVKTIVLLDGVSAPEDSSNLFNSYSFNWRFNNLTSIIGQLDTSRVTNMGHMLWGLKKLKTVDVSNWDTSQVTNMSSLFAYTDDLIELDVSDWDTSQVTQMSGMFHWMKSLKTVDVSKWDTSQVRDMSYMFSISDFIELDVSKWDTSQVRNMSAMFSQTIIPELDVSDWDTSQVTNMRDQFARSNILRLDLSRWDTSLVERMTSMFESASVSELNLTNWDTSKVRLMEYMFSGAKNLQYLTLGPKIKFNAEVGLPMIDSSGEYTGEWKKVNPISPLKVYADSDQFMSDYDGTTPGTYAWRKKTDLAELIIKDSVISVGTNWQPEDNFVSAKNNEGNEIGFSDITVTGSVNVAVPGRYEVVYTYEGLTEVAVISVMAKQEAGAVTVNYVDTLGNVLATDRLEGEVGMPYMTETKEFAGYVLKITPNNASGTFSKNPQTVTYVYEAGRGATITVKYINQEGNEIAATKTLNGKVGQSFTETAKMPSGYELIGDSVRTFTVTAEPQTVVFEYVGKNASKLTIQYVDEATGDQIAPLTNITGGKTGDAYSAEVKVIPGYTVVDDSKATGFRPFGATTYQITYKKNDTIPFDLNYVGVNQQKVIGFLPTGVTTTQLNLYVKKAGDSEWKDSGYTGTADAETGYFAIESRLVKGGKGFLLENQDQVKVVFTGNDGNSYEAVKVVQPYTAPVVNVYIAGEDSATGTVPNGANYVRLAINNIPTRTVATTPTSGSSLPGNIDAKTGNFTVYAKNYSDGGKLADTKVGDTLTFDYGLQIYGVQNNPSTTIIAK